MNEVELKYAAGHGGSLKGLHFLVVDDAAIDREVTTEALVGAGAAVSHGCDGSEAMLLAAGGPFDGIILDIEMPHLNGLEVARRLRRMGIETPIYAVTSLSIAPSDPRREKVNISGWFRKPLDGPSLVEALSLRGQYAIGALVQTDSSPETPIQSFDFDRLAGASPRILAVVERFTLELEAIVNGIAAVAEPRDEEQLKSKLHRLRGAAGSCGFSALMAAVERWENAIDQQSDDASYLVGLRRAAEDGRAAFRQFFDSRGEQSLNA